MKYSTRILAVTLLAFTGFGANQAASSGLTVIGGDDRSGAAVEWAVEQFDRAGLTLPPIVVEFHSDNGGCDGYDGAFRGRERPFRIDVCTPNRYVVLHEMAHAWERHTLSDEIRHEFMTLRGLTEWNGDAPWKEKGVEDLAEIVTWGLHEDPISADSDERAQAFGLVTGGIQPRSIQIADAKAGAGVADDPLDAASDWDTLR